MSDFVINTNRPCKYSEETVDQNGESKEIKKIIINDR